MPYFIIQDLPLTIRSHLPKRAQEIYRRVFNKIWDLHRDPATIPTGETRVSLAAKVAWTAVRAAYEKRGSRWVRNKKRVISSEKQIEKSLRKKLRSNNMPYARNEDLPDSVRNHLPARAQTIYRKAFNSAWHEYGPSDERSARVAWSAVKKSFKKSGDRWVAKSSTKTRKKSITKD